MARPFLKIGTRGSPLALAQSHEVRSRLAACHGVDEASIEIIVIRTTGDLIQDRPLGEVGGKGLFTRELDLALFDESVDICVHSSKDLPTALPHGIDIVGYLPREDVRDAFVSAKAGTLRELPHGATLGTASLRRQAQVLRLRPDIQITLLRGNVETRLRKAESGEIDATLLAMAGLKRLGLAHRATAELDVEDFLPAVGQGAIAIAARADNTKIHTALAPILHRETGYALATERAFLAILDGSCKTPIAGHACVAADQIRFRGMVLRTDGSEIFETHRSGLVTEAAHLGAEAGRAVLERLPPGVLP